MRDDRLRSALTSYHDGATSDGWVHEKVAEVILRMPAFADFALAPGRRILERYDSGIRGVRSVQREAVVSARDDLNNLYFGQMVLLTDLKDQKERAEDVLRYFGERPTDWREVDLDQR